MPYAGGLRARLIRDSFYNMIHHSLDQLGWFDTNRDHIPINMVPKEVSLDEEISLNTLSVSADTASLTQWEMGSNLEENRQLYYVDFYAEDDSIGTHMIFDVRDILSGKMSSIGRFTNVFTVYDYTLATPVPIFDCELDNVTVSRSRNPSKTWQKFWYSIQLSVLDYYSDDTD
jgi:hypothetical protein